MFWFCRRKSDELLLAQQETNRQLDRLVQVLGRIVAHEYVPGRALMPLTKRLQVSTNALAGAVAACGGDPHPPRHATGAMFPMNPDLQALENQVTATQGVLDSATVFINGVPGLIQAAVDKAIAGGATAAQLAPLSQLASDMKAKSDALTAAIAANSPAPTPPAPAPTS